MLSSLEGLAQTIGGPKEAFASTSVYLQFDRTKSSQSNLLAASQAIAQVQGVIRSFPSTGRFELLVIVEDNRLNDLESELKNLINTYHLEAVKKFYIGTGNQSSTMARKGGNSNHKDADAILTLLGLSDKIEYLKNQSPQDIQELTKLQTEFERLNQ